jgi:hypothetical protein
VSFAAINLCVASQRVLIVVSIYFVIDSVRNFWIHRRGLRFFEKSVEEDIWT